LCSFFVRSLRYLNDERLFPFQLRRGTPARRRAALFNVIDFKPGRNCSEAQGDKLPQKGIKTVGRMPGRESQDRMSITRDDVACRRRRDSEVGRMSDQGSSGFRYESVRASVIRETVCNRARQSENNVRLLRYFSSSARSPWLLGWRWFWRTISGLVVRSWLSSPS